MSDTVHQEIRVCVAVHPGDDASVFRITAADDILRLLVDAHETEFSIPELVDATGVARSTVWRAIDLLDQLDVLRIRETPQRNYISIDPTVLEKDDPILAIEQPEFHEPIRAFIGEVQDALARTDACGELVGVVVFGSVARGTADRQSDIDLFVVVTGDRTAARRCVTDVVSELRDRRFDGDRFAFEHYVESVESARRAGKKLAEIFDNGITVYGTDELQTLRKAVLTDE